MPYQDRILDSLLPRQNGHTRSWFPAHTLPKTAEIDAASRATAEEALLNPSLQQHHCIASTPPPPWLTYVNSQATSPRPPNQIRLNQLQHFLNLLPEPTPTEPVFISLRVTYYGLPPPGFIRILFSSTRNCLSQPLSLPSPTSLPHNCSKLVGSDLSSSSELSCVAICNTTM
jgi:hypothetical protein